MGATRLGSMSAACVLLLSLGCDSATGPFRPELTLESGIVFGIPTLPTQVRVADGVMIVTGVIQTPGTGFTLLGDVTLMPGNDLVVHIHAYDNAPGFAFPSQNYYRATVKNLSSGDYSVSVIHHHHAPSPGFSQKVFFNTVAIP